MYELQYMGILINDKEKKRNVKEQLLIYIIKKASDVYENSKI